MSNKAVFFDRDGTIVTTANYGNETGVAPREPEDLNLIPKTKSVIQELHNLGFLIIVISNQPDIALDKIDMETKEKLEEKFKRLIESNRLPIEEVYYCYHHPDSVNPNYPKDCTCHKPKPGMINDAANKFDINLSKSWMIGDRYKDILAGQTAGCRTILIKRPWSDEEKCEPDFIVENLSEVVDIVKKKS